MAKTTYTLVTRTLLSAQLTKLSDKEGVMQPHVTLETVEDDSMVHIRLFDKSQYETAKKVCHLRIGEEGTPIQLRHTVSETGYDNYKLVVDQAEVEAEFDAMFE